MLRALSVIDTVASSTCTVLITGESGTGKELAVAALHDASPRARGPLVAVNCGAIPENLVESELFGHARGAFTGALEKRVGFVAAAEDGTLFLDEVGELPLSAQVKLLRLLQAREFTVVGTNRPSKSNARIVAATNRDLEVEVQKGRFREDLYYRLNVIPIELPPLRERRSDIASLAHHFLRLSAERSGARHVVGFSTAAIEALEACDWPGNIRALENCVERAVLLARGPIVDLDVLGPSLPKRAMPELAAIRPMAAPPASEPSLKIDFRASVDEFETKLLRQALDSVGWNQRRAAACLGLQRTTLIEMMKRKGLLVVQRRVA